MEDENGENPFVDHTISYQHTNTSSPPHRQQQSINNERKDELDQMSFVNNNNSSSSSYAGYSSYHQEEKINVNGNNIRQQQQQQQQQVYHSDQAAEARLAQEIEKTYQVLRHTSLDEKPFIANSGEDLLYNQMTRSAGRSFRTAQATVIYPDFSTNNNNSDRAITPAALPQIIFRMRVINLTLSAFAILISLMSLIGYLFSPQRFVMCLYLGFLSALLFCFESHTPWVSNFIEDNFGFMYNSRNRALYMLLLGTIGYQLTGLGFIVGICLALNAIYTLYIISLYPEFDQAHKNIGREDITRVAQRTSDEKPWQTLSSLAADSNKIAQMFANNEVQGFINRDNQGAYSVVL